MNTEEMNLAQLGEKLKYIRSVMGLTQDNLAEKIGVKQVNIARLENGGSTSASTLMAVLTYYSQYVSIDVLFDEKAWQIACMDRELLMKKVHINSIVEAKLTLMKDALLKQVEQNRREAEDNNKILADYITRGMDSAISMFEEE